MGDRRRRLATAERRRGSLDRRRQLRDLSLETVAAGGGGSGGDVG